MIQETVYKRRNVVKDYQEDGQEKRIKATLELSSYGGGEPYFSMTGELYEKGKGGGWIELGGGAIGEEIGRQIPYLAPFEKWHLFYVNSGPVHYEANAVYWWELGTARRSRELERKPPDYYREIFKEHVIFGTAPTWDNINPFLLMEPLEESPNPDDPHIYIRPWLRARLEEVRAAFLKDMEALYGSPVFMGTTDTLQRGPLDAELSTPSPADVFLEKTGLTMEADRIDGRPDLEGTGATHLKEAYHFKCTLYHGEKSAVFYWSQGHGLGTEPPTLERLFTAILDDARASFEPFEQWAAELGFDPDSRKAEKIYDLCKENNRRLLELLGKELMGEALDLELNF